MLSVCVLMFHTCNWITIYTHIFSIVHFGSLQMTSFEIEVIPPTPPFHTMLKSYFLIKGPTSVPFLIMLQFLTLPNHLAFIL